MKRILFGVIVLATVATLYYLTLGSSQLTKELKTIVSQELQSMESQGFAIEGREIKEQEEHFEIVWEDTAKIAEYLNAQGAAITAEDAGSLKGMKIGVDLNYLKDSYSAISLDLYPTALPDAMTQKELEREEKEVLAKIDELFKTRTFLIHVDISKSLDEFKGSMKDINQTFGVPGAEVVMAMKAMSFEGDIKNDRISAVNQSLQSFQINAEEGISIQVLGLESHYSLHGPTHYDTMTGYSIEKFIYRESPFLRLSAESMEADSKTVFKNNLAQTEISARIGAVHVTEKHKTDKASNLALEMEVSNLDIKSFEKLQHISSLDQQQIDRIARQILSKGLSIKIPKLSVGKLYFQNREMDGFDIDARIDLNKNIDLSSLQANPMLGLAAVRTDLNLSFSETFFTFISQQPQAMILMMMFRPTEKNDRKNYHIKLENGTLTVNGVAMQ
ncbi:MAG: hypothetical protein ABXS92_03325 [Sulfurimonas sp.]